MKIKPKDRFELNALWVVIVLVTIIPFTIQNDNSPYKLSQRINGIKTDIENLQINDGFKDSEIQDLKSSIMPSCFIGQSN